MADRVRVGDLQRMAEALGADLGVRLRWRGEELDRLLDEAHAELVNATLALLLRLGWDAAVEVSFSKWGERGSMDILAFHQRSGLVLVVEVKSVIPDSQSMLFALDRKTRLAPDIARDRGWVCRGTARLLVAAESSTSRRRVAALGQTFRVAFPQSGRSVRHWLREPSRPMSGLLFLPHAPGSRTNVRIGGVQRVRKRDTPACGSRMRPHSADDHDPGSKPG
jgi:hypothetical protein